MAPPSISSSSNRPNQYPSDNREFSIASACFPLAGRLIESLESSSGGLSAQPRSAPLQQELVKAGGIVKYLLAESDKAVKGAENKRAGKKQEEENKAALERVGFAWDVLAEKSGEQAERVRGALGLPTLPGKVSTRDLFASPLPKVPQSQFVAPELPVAEVNQEELADGLAEKLLELVARMSATTTTTKGKRKRKDTVVVAQLEQEIAAACQAMIGCVMRNRIADAQKSGFVSPVPTIATSKGPQTPSGFPTSGAATPRSRTRSGALSPVNSEQGPASKRARK